MFGIQEVLSGIWNELGAQASCPVEWRLFDPKKDVDLTDYVKGDCNGEIDQT